MTQFIKKQCGKDGNWYAILRDRKSFAVCQQGAYTWRYKKRNLTLDAAEQFFAAYIQ
jgi:hypothetical protein